MKQRLIRLRIRFRRLADRVHMPLAFAFKLYSEDQLVTNAATITLFMVMSLFPLLMILLWIMSRLLIKPDVLLRSIETILPEDFMSLVESVVTDLYAKSLSVPALSITIIAALWSSSTGISFLVSGLNRVYKREEQRNWFVHRGLCLLYTGAFVGIILIVLFFLVFGKKLQGFLIDINPDLKNWMWLIAILQQIFAIGGMILFFLAVYNIFPQRKLPYLKQMPGAIVSTVGWYVFSTIYSLYIKTSQNLAYMYGSLTIIIVFLIWLYVLMMIILIGGEVNFLYNNRYYYKLFQLTEQRIDIHEYYMHTDEISREQRMNPEAVDEAEIDRRWQEAAASNGEKTPCSNDSNGSEAEEDSPDEK